MTLKSRELDKQFHLHTPGVKSERKVRHLFRYLITICAIFRMFSARALTRSVPRILSRLSAPLARQPLSTLRQPCLLLSSWNLASRPRFAGFSTSRVACEQAGEGTYNGSQDTLSGLIRDPVDQELSAKLESELQMEKDMRDPDELPPSIKDYLSNGPFEVCSLLRS